MSKYVVVKSSIDNLFRVMLNEDAPFGTCYSVAETKTEAIQSAHRGFDIDPEEIEDW